MSGNNNPSETLKSFAQSVSVQYHKFRKFFKETYNKRIIYMYILNALVLNLLIEMLARHSVLKGVYYLISSPYVFICNSMIILVTLSVTLLMRRRIFGMSVISFVWLAFGIANSILLSYRVTPFTAVDLKLIDSAIAIMNKYVSVPMIILIALLAAGGVAGLVLIWRKIPKVDHKIKIFRNLGAIAIILALCMGSINLGIGSHLLDTKFGNLADSYKKYGFVYCFVNSLVNTGIDKPSDYSDKTIDTLKNEQKKKTKAKKKPNILFLQLESFFDVNHMQDLSYSRDPVPYFTQLKKQYPHGYLNVPIVGAGTVNTEFEVMTGMNLDDFGPGEIPFKTILKEKTCESICFNLKKYNYTCHAIHNNTATFYSRNVVFSHFGYDTFTSVENMNNIEEYTPKGWAKDKYLTEYITGALNSTEKQDYIYTISVQGHGEYPSDPADYDITVEGIKDDDERLYSFEYYISQINEMDSFLNELTAALEAFGEDTILVLYGDHLPSLGITEEELDNGDLYQTEYVIWSNFDAGFTNEDIESYQLQAKILGQFDMTTGDINHYSQQHRNDEDKEAYLSGLKNLEYDMLYGDNLLYNGDNPYQATDIQFGLYPVKITSVAPLYDDQGTVYLYGNNFTKYSAVYLNGDKYDSEYIDPSTLVLYYPELKEGDRFAVYQQNSDTHILNQTEPVTFEDENLGNAGAKTGETETQKQEKQRKKADRETKKNQDK